MGTKRKVTSTNYRNRSFLEKKCSLNELLDLVSKRWISEVLFCIAEGNNRFRTIKEELTFISDTVLADRLKLLEKCAFIHKVALPAMPVRVEYSLTENGKTLCRLLETMCNFSDTLPGMNN